MYNFEQNRNASQFLITFKPLRTLDERHVVFGRVVHGLHTLRLVRYVLQAIFRSLYIFITELKKCLFFKLKKNKF